MCGQDSSYNPVAQMFKTSFLATTSQLSKWRLQPTQTSCMLSYARTIPATMSLQTTTTILIYTFAQASHLLIDSTSLSGFTYRLPFSYPKLFRSRKNMWNIFGKPWRQVWMNASNEDIIWTDGQTLIYIQSDCQLCLNDNVHCSPMTV